MLDPFRHTALGPFQPLLIPIAEPVRLTALPLHAHEVLIALTLYTFIAQILSPAASAYLLPNAYPNLDRRTKISWHIHVVSFMQSCIVSALSFYVIFFDEERKTWRPDENWEMRVWGYTGLTGLLQSFALGYFIFDLYKCLRHVAIFGWGMVLHAVASSAMFTFGFRPFIHFYCPVFLLHELSTPFLNIHWFCDKLDLTGSIYQAVNGIFLVTTFFCCRLAWGTYGSWNVSRDVYRATFARPSAAISTAEQVSQSSALAASDDLLGQTVAFMATRPLPVWLGLSYLTANVSLTLLNVFWFLKMMQAIRKRFVPQTHGREARSDKQNSSKDK
ncbi:putative TLC domain-containing protein C17A2.02c [Pseudocercospora fuligena]|uniref:Putative TLC domain-containing protein C17A2.02c n=1 Tax=Pseudocercospora fuligena TaxID=685502 RepID=A0A8H6VLY1_9PEZI|nr:putative TLC domain-containing protein C17A2.02c [Pseudocercospora fuligena]